MTAALTTTDDHVRWCSCGQMLAGSTRQIVAMAEVHWRHTGCDWRLHDTPQAERKAA